MDSWATAASDVKLDVFRISAGGVLRTAPFSEAGGWSGWSTLGGPIFPPNQDVCAVAGPGGVVHVLAVDLKGAIQHFTKAGAGWQGPSAVPGLTASDPSLAAACPDSGALSVFARAVGDGKVVPNGIGQPGAVARAVLGAGGGAWSPWTLVGDPKATEAFGSGTLGATVQPGGQVWLFAESDPGAMVVAVPAGNPGAAVWKLSAQDINGRPSGVARTATSLDVVALDPFRIATSDTAIAGGAWQDPQYSDQEADSQPAKGVAIDANTVAVIGYGELAASGIIVSRVTIDGKGHASWGAWQLVPGDPAWKGVDLCAILRGGKHLHLFVNHDDGMLTAGCDTSAAIWTWSAWTEIKAPDGPHWQLVGKPPTLTRTGTVFRLIPNWFGLLFGRK